MWGFPPPAAKEPVPYCGNCGQEVPDVPASCAQHAVVYCSEWCSLAGQRLRNEPKKPGHLK